MKWNRIAPGPFKKVLKPLHELSFVWLKSESKIIRKVFELVCLESEVAVRSDCYSLSRKACLE